ncbi:hypothetical protein V6N12_050013 [Hibiscus sabdariffa]|uniref:Uncharacterized protein n=1 Tax=Hibiscus sabdariffa TaxID=183260 RepID=A0ABR2GBK7_9ROSI
MSPGTLSLEPLDMKMKIRIYNTRRELAESRSASFKFIDLLWWARCILSSPQSSQGSGECTNLSCRHRISSA